MRRILIVLSACGFLAACSDWMGENAEPPLPGKRISVLSQSKTLEPDKGEQSDPITLPPPDDVADWPQAGGYPPHAMYHLAMRDKLKHVWTADVGAGADKRRAFLTSPVVANGIAYAMDAESTVSAFTMKSGKRRWSHDLKPKKADAGSYGGGLAFADGYLFVTTSYGELICLETAKGKTVWRQPLPAPVRGAPTVRGGRVLVITVDNQTLAYSGEDGHQLWHHNGINEATTLMGGTSPAVDGNTVIVAYSSGELYALRIENGTPIWSEGITSVKRTDQVGTMTDIQGLPVIDNGRVYVAGNSDLTASIDMRSGRRVWDREVGSIQTPWIAGDYLYLITNTPELICLEAKTGRIRWVTGLKHWQDEEEKSGRITWTGPVLGSDRLIIASSEGFAMAISPYTGEILGKIQLDDGVTIPPVLADGTLLFVTKGGELSAYR